MNRLRTARQPAKTLRTRLAVGFMTGTSLDGLDGVLVAVRGRGLELGLVEIRGRVRAGLGRTGDGLRQLAEGTPLTAEAISRLAWELGQVHARALRRLLGQGRPELVAVHGQTVFHRPPLSWQLLNPAPIADVVPQAAVVFDLRSADLAAGGQGAPITPLSDWILFRHPRQTRVVVNLGGFCNWTRLPAGLGPERVTGGDRCACNQVLDAVARQVLGKPYDPGGRHAARGSADPAAGTALRRVLDQQAGAGRSLGSGDEAQAWVTAWRNRLSSADLAASAAEAIGATIGVALGGADRVLLAGGGVRHRPLVAAITRHAGCPVETTDQHGVPASDREAVAMAILGILASDGIPIALPQITGARQAVPSGCWIQPKR